MLKNNIETNNINNLIKTSKFPLKVLIIFVKYFHKSFELVVDHINLNNLIIKN